MLRTGTPTPAPAAYTVAPTFATYEEAEVHADALHYVEWQYTAYAVLPYTYDRPAASPVEDADYDYRYDGWH